MNSKTNQFMKLSLLLLSFFFYSFVAAQENLTEIVKKISPSVVLVITYDEQGKGLSQGSGFFINAQGEVITNFHVLAKASRAEIKTSDGKVYPVKDVLAEDKINDLIRVSVDMLKQKVIPLSVISSVPQVGEKIAVVGNPLGLEQTVTDGIVSAVRDIPGFGKIVQITAPLSPGSSGSPVVNMKGEVIGIATLQITEGQNLNFAIPGNQIAKLTLKKQTSFTAWRKKETRSASFSEGDPLVIGAGFFKVEKYEEALPYFEKAAKQDPKNNFAYVLIGYCNYNLGRYNEAVEAFKQAIRLKPDYAEAHSGLGLVYAKLGRYNEAVEAYKQAIRIEPDDALAHLQLGTAYAQLGRYNEAVEAYKQASRIKPDLALAHLQLGMAYAQLGRYNEAVEAFKQAIRLKPDYALAPLAHLVLGVAYAELDRYNEAVEAFKQAIRLKPDYAEAHLVLGGAYLVLGDKASALEEYKILQNLDKEKADKLFNAIYK